MKHNLSLLSFLMAAVGVATMHATEAGAGGKSATILDLDNMFDISMDSVETLPDFCNPPAGIYEITVNDAKVEAYKPKPTTEAPNPAEQKRLKFIYSVDKTIELGDKKELPVKDGSLFSESFMATEEGLKYFKRQSMNIMNVSDLVGASLKDVLDGVKGQSFKAAITVVKTPGKEAGTTYENIRVRPVHDAAPTA